MGYHVEQKKRAPNALDPYKTERAKYLYMTAEVINVRSIAMKVGLKYGSVEHLIRVGEWAAERDKMIVEARYGQDLRKAYTVAKQNHAFARKALQTAIKTARTTDVIARKNKKTLSANKIKELQKAINDARFECTAAQQEIAMIKRVFIRRGTDKPGKNWTQFNPIDTPKANITDQILSAD